MRSKGPLGVALLVLLAGPTQTLSAQGDNVSEQIWLDYNPRVLLPSNLELFGDIGYRTEVGAQDWSRLVVRPSVQGPVGLFQWSGGVGGFFTFNELIEDRIEIRPFFGSRNSSNG